MVWPTLGSRKAKEQNRADACLFTCLAVSRIFEEVTDEIFMNFRKEHILCKKVTYVGIYVFS